MHETGFPKQRHLSGKTSHTCPEIPQTRNFNTEVDLSEMSAQDITGLQQK